MLIKANDKTDLRYGKKPEQRSIDDLINFGVINLDKPMGPNSHQITSWVKEILGIKKAGHGGTLDPRVTGVLPITLGNATKSVETLLYGSKEYVCLMRVHKDFNEKKLKELMSEFVGKIYQTPPIRSAVKRILRVREIYSIKILEVNKRDILFRVSCEAGTYIRTLCRDIGEILGTKAHMQELRRIRTCNFKEEESITLHQLKDAFFYWKENKDEKYLRKVIHPMEKILEHLPKIIIRDSTIDAICHGANLALPGILQLDKNIKKGNIVAILTLKGEGVAYGKTLMSSEEMMNKDEGIAVDLERVLMNIGIYPSVWKKKY